MIPSQKQIEELTDLAKRYSAKHRRNCHGVFLCEYCFCEGAWIDKDISIFTTEIGPRSAPDFHLRLTLPAKSFLGRLFGFEDFRYIYPSEDSIAWEMAINSIPKLRKNVERMEAAYVKELQGELDRATEHLRKINKERARSSAG